MRRVERLADEIAGERYRGARALFLRRDLRPPFLLWGPRESDLPSSILVKALRWWAQLPRQDGLPGVCDPDPRLLGAAADYTALVEPLPDGSDFRHVQVGKALLRAGGPDFRAPLASAVGGHTAVFIAAVYRAVMQRREPIYTEHEPFQHLFITQTSRLILPLVGRQGGIERLVVTCLPEAPLQTLADTVMDGVLVFDRGGTIRLVNEAGLRLFGVDEDWLLNRPVRDVLLADFIATGLGSGTRIVTPPRETMARRLDGQEFPVEISIGATQRGSRGVFVAVVRDISARKATEEHYRTLAFTDPLTGLANRFLFHDHLSHALARARRSGHQLAVFMMDLDAFKAINDTYGHPTGDKALKEFARRIRTIVREADVLARLGGDEFALVQTDLSEVNGTVRLAERLLAVLAEPLAIDGGTLPISASLGVAIYPDDGSTAQALMEHADRALYTAKSQGGGRCVLYGELHG